MLFENNITDITQMDSTEERAGEALHNQHG